MQSIKLPQIQGFDLTLTLKDSILTLDVQEESSGRIFSLDLDENSIDQTTYGLFQTSEGLFRGFQEGANKRCPGITLSMSEGEFIYTVFFLTDTVQNYSFSLNPSAFVEKTCQVPETSIASSVNSDPKPPYNLSEDNRTVTSNIGAYPCYKISSQLGHGKHGFSLKLNQITEGFCCGITTERGELKSAFDRSEFSYEYWTMNGRISGRVSKGPSGGSKKIDQGSILHMIVDTEQGTLTFFVDGQQVNSCPISNSENYFAYISVGSAGDSVTYSYFS